jgi:hypothetical protein
LVVGILALSATSPSRGVTIFAWGATATIGLGLLVVALNTDPAYFIVLGTVLSPFSGNWDAMGIPSFVSPNRWLVVIGIAAVVLEAYGDPATRWRVAAVDWLLVATGTFAILSAVVVGSIWSSTAVFSEPTPQARALIREAGVELPETWHPR